jgi:hypothetical protein
MIPVLPVATSWLAASEVISNVVREGPGFRRLKADFPMTWLTLLSPAAVPPKPQRSK